MHEQRRGDYSPKPCPGNPGVLPYSIPESDGDRKAKEDGSQQAGHVRAKNYREHDVRECIDSDDSCKHEHCVGRACGSGCPDSYERKRDSEECQYREAEPEVGDIDLRVERSEESGRLAPYQAQHIRCTEGLLNVVKGERASDKKVPAVMEMDVPSPF
jgi:hypothetical protein